MSDAGMLNVVLWLVYSFLLVLSFFLLYHLFLFTVGRLLWWRAREPRQMKVSLWSILWGDCLELWWVFWGAVALLDPWRLHRYAPLSKKNKTEIQHSSSVMTQTTALLFVHGAYSNSGQFFWLRRYFYHRGKPSYAVDMGRGFVHPERWCQPLTERLQLLYEKYDTIDIVCHSMGGVVLRAVLREHPEYQKMIRKVVTIASPHKGSSSLDYVPIPEARALKPSSAWIQELPTLSELLPHARMLAISSEDDLIVHPVSRTVIDNHPQYVVSCVGHVSTTFHRGIRQQIEDFCR